MNIKAENDALRDVLPLVVVNTLLSLSVMREATTASGVDNAASDWQTPLNGIISPQREA